MSWGGSVGVIDPPPGKLVPIGVVHATSAVGVRLLGQRGRPAGQIQLNVVGLAVAGVFPPLPYRVEGLIPGPPDPTRLVVHTFLPFSCPWWQHRMYETSSTQRYH